MCVCFLKSQFNCVCAKSSFFIIFIFIRQYISSDEGRVREFARCANREQKKKILWWYRLADDITWVRDRRLRGGSWVSFIVLVWLRLRVRFRWCWRRRRAGVAWGRSGRSIPPSAADVPSLLQRNPRLPAAAAHRWHFPSVTPPRSGSGSLASSRSPADPKLIHHYCYLLFLLLLLLLYHRPPTSFAEHEGLNSSVVPVRFRPYRQATHSSSLYSGIHIGLVSRVLFFLHNLLITN